MDEYDYIIIGAGSAGCVLAEGLARDPGCRILVLEAGGSDRRFAIRMPIGYGRVFFDPRVNWMYHAEPDPETGGRASYWPRGKVVGGSGSINALIYFRGLPGDFADWEAQGATGWGWDAVRAEYEAIETRVGEDGRHEGHGPMFVTNTRREIHASNRHYFDMAREMGLPVIDDCNGAEPEGITHYRITTRHGRRWSSADAFLRPALARGNVTLVTHALVEKITITDGRATGVVARTRSGRPEFRSRGEVILAAGAVNSPQLLQLSGIGPGEVLRRNGIDIIRANDNVGGNLQDHLGINYYYKATEPTLNSLLSPWWGKLFQGARYVLTRRGPLGLSVNQCGGFIRSREGLKRPDQQIYLNPVTYTTSPEGARPIINPDPFPGFILSFQPCRPTSRGRIDISSPDPTAAPRIMPAYLSTQHDLDDVVAGGRLIQRMARTRAMRAFTREAMAPDIVPMDDDAILADFRQRCGTVFHPVATCRMGADERSAVTDSHLRVFGIRGLRIADASSFPSITSGNTNAPVIMLAHRAARLILKDRPGTAATATGNTP